MSLKLVNLHVFPPIFVLLFCCFTVLISFLIICCFNSLSCNLMGPDPVPNDHFGQFGPGSRPNSKLDPGPTWPGSKLAKKNQICIQNADLVPAWTRVSMEKGLDLVPINIIYRYVLNLYTVRVLMLLSIATLHVSWSPTSIYDANISSSSLASNYC